MVVIADADTGGGHLGYLDCYQIYLNAHLKVLAWALLAVVAVHELGDRAEAGRKVRGWQVKGMVSGYWNADGVGTRSGFHSQSLSDHLRMVFAGRYV